MVESAADELISEEAVRWAKANRKAFAKTITSAEMFPGEKHPVAMFMADSPGAGKTEASKALVSELGSFLRIDPDEFRRAIPGYDGSNARLMHRAVSYLVAAVLDRAFELKQSFLLDGTFSSYEVAEKNVQRCLDKGRQVQVVYVYQEPHLAWQFVQARELVEGRSIPAERFVHQFFESRAVVDRLKVKFPKEIKVDVLLKNIDGSSGRYLANVPSLKATVPIHYTPDQVTKMVAQPV